jgi:predicted GIY-YIG superfamily endonuclease
MILDITHYDARRNRHGNPVVGKREGSGRPSRATEAPEFMVYLVQVEGNSRTKIGRTQHIKARLAQYQHNSGGVARSVAQMLVSSRSDSVTLESQAVRYLRTRYDRSGNEWFDIPPDDVPGVLADIVANATVTISEVRGMPGSERPEHSTFDEARVEAVQAERQFKRRRNKRA